MRLLPAVSLLLLLPLTSLSGNGNDNSTLPTDPDLDTDPKWLEEADAKNLPRKVRYRTDVPLRMLDGRKKIFSYVEPNPPVAIEPPKDHRDNTKLVDGKKWEDLVIAETRRYYSDYLVKYRDATKKAVLTENVKGVYTGPPSRAYPFCVDGIRPFAHETKRMKWADVKPQILYPQHGFIDDDLYRFIPFFKMAQPRNGIPVVLTAVKPIAGGGIASWGKHETEASKGARATWLTNFRMFLVRSPQVKDGGMDTGKQGTPPGDPKHLLDPYGTWFPFQMIGNMHLVFEFRSSMQGLFIQAIGHPTGLPFGTFTDAYDCQGNGKLKTDFIPFPSTTSYRQRMRLNHPNYETRKIHTTIPCKYMHGSLHGAVSPGVYAYGGSRKAPPEQKFQTFRVTFQYALSDNCNNAYRMQFLVLAVKSFINAEFDVFLTRNFLSPTMATYSQFPHPFLEDHRDRLFCEDFRYKPGDHVTLWTKDNRDNFINNPYIVDNFQPEGGNPGTIIGWPYGFAGGWVSDLKEKDPKKDEDSKIPIPYSKEYDDCILDLDGKHLDHLGICPPKSVCFNTDNHEAQWQVQAQQNQKAANKLASADNNGPKWRSDSTTIIGYWNPVSVVRFPLSTTILHRWQKEHFIDLKDCQKFCQDPRESIPYLKVQEQETLQVAREDKESRGHSGCVTNPDAVPSDLLYYLDDDVCKLGFSDLEPPASEPLAEPQPDETPGETPVEPTASPCGSQGSGFTFPAPPQCPYGPNEPGGPDGPPLFGEENKPCQPVVQNEHQNDTIDTAKIPAGCPYGLRAPYSKDGPYGPFGPFGPFGDQGPYTYQKPYGPYGPFGPYSPYGPYGPFGPYGHRGPYGHKGPYGPFGPFGPCGVDGPDCPRAGTWENDHTEGLYDTLAKVNKLRRSTHVWSMYFGWFVLLAIANFTARFYKETGGIDRNTKNSFFGIGLWIWLHIFLNLLAMTLIWIGISESLRVREKPYSCNFLDEYMAKDILLKDFCRWRKEITRIHAGVGYAAVVFFHLSFGLGWLRVTNAFEGHRIWNYHMYAGYFGKLLAFLSVMVLFMPKGFAICKDIPILTIGIQLMTFAFMILGCWLQSYADRRHRVVGRSYFPTVEGVSAGNTKTNRKLKIVLFMTFVCAHLVVFLITSVSIHMVYDQDGDNHDVEGEFETHHGLFSSCRVPSRITERLGLKKAFEDESTQLGQGQD